MISKSLSSSQCFFLAKEITRCQDYQSLTHAFINLLEDFCWVDSVQAYEIFSQRKKRNQDNQNEAVVVRRFPLDFNADENTDDCPLLSTRPLPKHIEVESSDAQSNLAILPVHTELGPARALLLQGRFDQGALDLLGHLLILYRNQLLLHDRKERDVLTRLPNRQSFEARLTEVCEFYQALTIGNQTDDKISWIAILDIDHFKAVNDTFGHLYGDEVLLHFSQLLEYKFRHIDFTFRFGGEEFVVIVNRVSRNDAEHILNRFRQEVENYAFPLVGKITVSIGATSIKSGMLPSTLLDSADKALYFAKEHGRNQVVLFENIPPPQSNSDANDVELF